MPKNKIFSASFDQNAFVASAAALAASHVMSDLVWERHFPKLPRKQPELRTVLINIHRHALVNKPYNRQDARQMIIESFDVAPGTAKGWLKTLQGLSPSGKRSKEGEELEVLIVEQPGERRQEKHLVPSAAAKKRLFRVGLEYLACLRLVGEQLTEAMDYNPVSIEDLDWLDQIKDILKLDIVDYATQEAAKSHDVAADLNARS